MDWKLYTIQIGVTVIAFVVACLVIGRVFEGVKNTIIANAGGWIINFTFLGVFHHELAHAFLAAITGAKITSITLFRISHKDGKLGEVKYNPRGMKVTQAIQVVLSSIAPMIMGAITLWLLGAFVFAKLALVGRIIVGYLMFSIFLHMSLSKQDIKNILGKMGYLLILLFIVFFVFNINIWQVFGVASWESPLHIVISAFRAK